MKKINFALISDTFFYTVCAFAISFTAVRFYAKSAKLALIISLAFSLPLGFLCFLHLFKKRKKKLAFLLDEGEKKSLALHLSVCGRRYIENLILSALDGTYMGDNYIEDENSVYFFNFKMSPVNADDIADIIKIEHPKQKCVLLSAITPDALSLSADFSIAVKSIGEIYLILKDKRLLPEKYALGEVKRKNVFKRIKSRFTRKLCPSLFFSGITLLLFSFFTFFPVYYIVAGTVLTTLSAVSLFIGQPS